MATLKNALRVLPFIFLTVILLAPFTTAQTKNPPKRPPRPAPTPETKPIPPVSPPKTETSGNDDLDILRVETQLVSVPTVILDRDGKPLTNLKAGNFTIYEDGKPQELANFATVAAPFEVALLLDTSGSTRADLDLIRRSAENFIASLREGDKVSIVAFKTEIEGGRKEAKVEILNGLTSDRNELKASLGTLNTSNGTPYYDGLREIAEKVFRQPAGKEARGRRAIVALTDGVDSVSEAEFEDVRDALQRQGISSYFVEVNTEDFFEERVLGDCDDPETLRFSSIQLRRYYRNFVKNPKAEKTMSFCDLGQFERLTISKRLYNLARSEMKELADKSGGKTFEVGSLREAKTAFQQVATEIGTQYSLGYYSSNEKRDGTFRKIRVELKGIPAGAKIQAREGYTAPKD